MTLLRRVFEFASVSIYASSVCSSEDKRGGPEQSNLAPWYMGLLRALAQPSTPSTRYIYIYIIYLSGREGGDLRGAGATSTQGIPQMTRLGKGEAKEGPPSNLGRLVREERHAPQRPVVPRLLRSALERHVEDEALDVGVARVAVAAHGVLVDGALVGAVLAE